MITLKRKIFSQSDPVLIRQFSKKLQSDPVLIRQKNGFSPHPVLIRAHLWYLLAVVQAQDLNKHDVLSRLRNSAEPIFTD